MSVHENHLEVYRDRPQPIQWKVPAFCNNDWIALSLLRMCKELGFARPFDIVYGAPQCAWQGGRPALMRQPLSDSELAARFEAYAQFGVRCALTLSRLDVEANAYDDVYGNRLLSVAESYRGQAIVADDGLASHIHTHYPGLETVASFDRALVDVVIGTSAYDDETAYYKNALEQFDEAVVRCEYALDSGRISQMTREQRAHLEVIVNQICVPDCQRGREHVEALERWGDGGAIEPCQECFHVGVAARIDERLSRNVLLSNKRIDELAAAGVRTFKIGGRNAPIAKFLDLLGTYVFEPSGAFIPMRVALSRQFTHHRETHLSFAPYDLPL